jgi:hypothetical protein
MFCAQAPYVDFPICIMFGNRWDLVVSFSFQPFTVRKSSWMGSLWYWAGHNSGCNLKILYAFPFRLATWSRFFL